MDPADIRRIAITAMFSDDLLMDMLVLKGGNALDLVHHLTFRGSYDIDFSIEGDFADVEEIRKRVFRALHDRFDAVGMIVFDEKFGPQPKTRRPGLDERWGGYRAEFKLIPVDKASTLENNLDAMRRNATSLSAAHDRVFRIEISKYEYVDGKVERELDAFQIYVYTPEMIAIEKLRAICQQMPEYALNPHGHARARDFYDIHTVVTKANVDLANPQNLDLIRGIFMAKDVPVDLMKQIVNHRELHRSDWPSVVQTITERPNEFDYYFDFVVEQVGRLESLWNE